MTYTGVQLCIIRAMDFIINCHLHTSSAQLQDPILSIFCKVKLCQGAIITMDLNQHQ